MILANQITKTYGQASDELLQNAIQLEASLGYEVLQTQKDLKGTSITYKRIENLKHEYRLRDLEKKVLKANGLLSTIRQDHDNFKVGRLDAFGHTKKVLWGALFAAILFDLIFILQLVLGFQTNFMEHIGMISLFLVIALGLHALHYFGFKYIKRRLSDEPFIQAIEELKALRDGFYHKAKQISKETK